MDVINDIDDVYITHTEHKGEPENYGTFQLTVEVPSYDRIDVDE